MEAAGEIQMNETLVITEKRRKKHMIHCVQVFDYYYFTAVTSTYIWLFVP